MQQVFFFPSASYNVFVFLFGILLLDAHSSSHPCKFNEQTAAAWTCPHPTYCHVIIIDWNPQWEWNWMDVVHSACVYRATPASLMNKLLQLGHVHILHIVIIIDWNPQWEWNWMDVVHSACVYRATPASSMNKLLQLGHVHILHIVMSSSSIEIHRENETEWMLYILHVSIGQPLQVQWTNCCSLDMSTSYILSSHHHRLKYTERMKLNGCCTFCMYSPAQVLIHDFKPSF